MRKPALGAVGKPEAVAPESGMISACQDRDDGAGCGTHIVGGIPAESHDRGDLRGPARPGACRPENKLALGFVEGLNNKIRVLQRRAYGPRDEEYLRLKVLTGMLPTL